MAPERHPSEVVEELLDEVAVEPETDGRRGIEALRGQVAVVTGGARGIGAAIAIEFARAGIHVAFNYLPDEAGSALKEANQIAGRLRDCGVRVLARPCDVRDAPACDDFVHAAIGELGGLHILVNNAGIARDGAIWKMPDADWRAVIDTNLTGAFNFIRAVSPHLRAQEYGKIVNVSSVHGVHSEFGLSNYTSSKAGLIGLTRSAAVELGPKNINVNAVAPGYIRTTRLTEGVSSELLDRARERAVLGRLGDPSDVSAVVLFLCSEAARHVTGGVIPIDGGYLL